MSLPKRIIIGISSGIAAYKIPSLIRLFKKANVEVKMVLTKNALNFVTPLTLETLSQNKVYTDVFGNIDEYTTQHITLSDWGDCMIVAPATANVIAKFAAGIADDALTTTFLSFNKNIFIAPTMNTKMLENPATQANINTLKKRGAIFIEPNSGFLACGYEGKGRMEEPENIFQIICNFYNKNQVLKNKKVVITAGPTHEPIDPVRFIGNYSSGKMGYSLAKSFTNLGADVTLIIGPNNLNLQNLNCNIVDVQTAEQMFNQCMIHCENADVIIMSAAVADFTVEQTAIQKIKKNSTNLNIKLVNTKDILLELGKRKKENQFIVGFALETENEIENALVKLNNKNIDAIVLNSLKDKNAGFGFDTNKITIINKKEKLKYELKPKDEVANDIADFVVKSIIK